MFCDKMCAMGVSMMFFVVLTATYLSQTVNSNVTSPTTLKTNVRPSLKTLHIIGLFALTGHWPEGLSFLPAALLAVKHINNNHSDILPGYKLQINAYNTECSEPVALNAFYREIYNSNRKSVMVLGSTCSPVTEITAQVSNLFGLQQISYSAMSPLLSDKQIFPTFFRVLTPEQNMTHARVKLFKEMGWTRVHTIYEDQKLFSSLNEIMKQDFQKHQIEVVTSEMFTTDPTNVAENLKKNDARVIVGSMYEDKARMLMCAIYSSAPDKGRPTAWYRKVVWLLPSMYFRHWMDIDDNNITCSPSQVKEVLGNYFTVGSQIISKEDSYVSDSGLTDMSVLLNGTVLYNHTADVIPEKFKELYQNKFFWDGSISGQHRAPQAYDAVWAIALALNNTMTYLKNKNISRRLEKFNYGKDVMLARLLHEGMINVSFNALSGPFHFNSNGERAHNLFISQYVADLDGADTFQDIGQCEKYNESDHWNCSVNKSLMRWPEVLQRKPPVDGIQKVKKVINIRCPYKFIYWSLSGLGILLTLGLLAFNIRKRKHRVIKMSSPNLNNVILLGCLLAYVSNYIMDFAWDGAPIACVAHTFSVVLSFSLCFGALFAKTWRVYEIFTAGVKVLNTKILKDRSLFLIVAVLVVINSLILMGWAVASTQAPTLVNISTTRSDTDIDIEYINQYQKCDSEYRLHFMSTLLALQGVVILFGTFLAIQTRNVTCPELNDSKWIALCIYNVVVLGPIGVVVVIVTADKPQVNYALEASMVLLITATTECLIFLPKIVAYRHQAKKLLIFSSNKLQVKRLSTMSNIVITERTLSLAGDRPYCPYCANQRTACNDDLTSTTTSQGIELADSRLFGDLKASVLFRVTSQTDTRKILSFSVDKDAPELGKHELSDKGNAGK